MLVAERILQLRQADGTVPVPVRVFQPRPLDFDWACKFTIGWPDGEFQTDVQGVDAFQALELAMRTIGVLLYTSEHHKTGKLSWMKAGDGYGFPITVNLRDLLVGSDKQFF